MNFDDRHLELLTQVVAKQDCIVHELKFLRTNISSLLEEIAEMKGDLREIRIHIGKLKDEIKKAQSPFI